MVINHKLTNSVTCTTSVILVAEIFQQDFIANAILIEEYHKLARLSVSQSQNSVNFVILLTQFPKMWHRVRKVTCLKICWDPVKGFFEDYFLSGARLLYKLFGEYCT